jgi:hypothetical protein
MTAEEAIAIATAFWVSSGLVFEDHSLKAIFCPATASPGAGALNDDFWDIWITYNPMKGLLTPDSSVVRVNCRTKVAKLISMA